MLPNLRELDDWLVIRVNHAVQAHRNFGSLAVFAAGWSARFEVALMGILWLAGFRRAVGRMLIAVSVVYALAELVGRLLPRRRPFARLQVVEESLKHPSGRSFPSRHVASAFAMAIVAQEEQPLIGLAMRAAAWALAASRVSVGLHYPSDVAGGALLGLLVGGVLRRKPAAT